MEKHVLYLMLQVMQWLDVRLAQLDRAFGYGPKGRGFESSSARCKKKGRCEKHLPFLFRSDAEDTNPGSYLRFAPVGAEPRSTYTGPISNPS